MLKHSLSVGWWQRQWLLLLWLVGCQCHWVQRVVYCQPLGRSIRGHQQCLEHGGFWKYLMQGRYRRRGLVSVCRRRWFHSAYGDIFEVWKAEVGHTYWGLIGCTISWRGGRCVVGSSSEGWYRCTSFLPGHWWWCIALPECIGCVWRSVPPHTQFRNNLLLRKILWGASVAIGRGWWLPHSIHMFQVVCGGYFWIVFLLGETHKLSCKFRSKPIHLVCNFPSRIRLWILVEYQIDVSWHIRVGQGGCQGRSS